MGSSRVERSWRWRRGGTRGQDGVGSSTEAVWRGDAAAARAECRVPRSQASSRKSHSRLRRLRIRESVSRYGVIRWQCHFCDFLVQIAVVRDPLFFFRRRGLCDALEVVCVSSSARTHALPPRGLVRPQRPHVGALVRLTHGVVDARRRLLLAVVGTRGATLLHS